jgi:hypothetical protein
VSDGITGQVARLERAVMSTVADVHRVEGRLKRLRAWVRNAFVKRQDFAQLVKRVERLEALSPTEKGR